MPEVLSKEEVEKFFSVVYNPIHRCAIRFMSDCGMRLMEVVNLKSKDVDLNKGLVRVIQGKGRKDRIIPLPQTSELFKLLPIFLGEPNDPIINHSREGKKVGFTPNSIQKWVYKYADESFGKGNVRAIHPHTFRHSYASYLLEKGADLVVVRDNLGHANLTSTSVYLHTAVESRKRAIDSIQF